MIRVKCPKPNCHNHTQVNEIFIGRPVRCSKCGTSFIIKSPPSAPRPAPQPPQPLMALMETPEESAAFAELPPDEIAASETAALLTDGFPETEWIDDSETAETMRVEWATPPMLDDLELEPCAENTGMVEKPFTADGASIAGQSASG